MIEKMVSKTLKDGIERFAKIHKVTPQQIQLAVQLDEDSEPYFRILKEFTKVPVRAASEDLIFENDRDREAHLYNITLLEIADKKIDFIGMTLIVPPFIQKQLLTYSEKLGVDKSNVAAIILLDQAEKIAILIYNGNTAVERVTIAEMLASA